MLLLCQSTGHPAARHCFWQRMPLVVVDHERRRASQRLLGRAHSNQVPGEDGKPGFNLKTGKLRLWRFLCNGDDVCRVVQAHAAEQVRPAAGKLDLPLAIRLIKSRFLDGVLLSDLYLGPHCNQCNKPFFRFAVCASLQVTSCCRPQGVPFFLTA